jgi:hypothetical protein
VENIWIVFCASALSGLIGYRLQQCDDVVLNCWHNISFVTFTVCDWRHRERWSAAGEAEEKGGREARRDPSSR